MTDDKIPFLRARLAEDAECARELGNAEWSDTGSDVSLTSDFSQPIADGRLYGDAHESLHTDERRHIARYDPARAFREVTARRARLDLYEDALRRWTELPREERATPDGAALRSKVTVLEVVIQGDMQSYALHPEFENHWLM